jgi:hypothetical protein
VLIAPILVWGRSSYRQLASAVKKSLLPQYGRVPADQKAEQGSRSREVKAGKK